jgi:hypothetical protein
MSSEAGSLMMFDVLGYMRVYGDLCSGSFAELLINVTEQ